MREIGRTSANGQKAYGNDPDNESQPQGVGSQRGSKRGVRTGVIKPWKEGEAESFLAACCFWIKRRANEKWR